MRNGDYVLVVAPDEYRGKKYRGKYCYEHHLVYWQNTGIVPDSDQLIHHKNENKHDNTFDNLELMTKSEHSKEHGLKQGKTYWELTCHSCNTSFRKERRGKKAPKYCSVACQWESLKGKRDTQIPHGTKNAYSYHKCRCALCSEANRLASSKYRNKKGAE